MKIGRSPDEDLTLYTGYTHSKRLNQLGHDMLKSNAIWDSTESSWGGGEGREASTKAQSEFHALPASTLAVV